MAEIKHEEEEKMTSTKEGKVPQKSSASEWVSDDMAHASSDEEDQVCGFSIEVRVSKGDETDLDVCWNNEVGASHVELGLLGFREIKSRDRFIFKSGPNG